MNNLDKWQDRSFSRPERMRAFEKWLFDEIYSILWDADRDGVLTFSILGYAGQLRGDTLRLIAETGHMGWFLDRDDLQDTVNKAVLAPLRRFRDGEVSDPYPYMKRVLSSFLNDQADWLKDKAMSAGTHINQLMGEVEGRQNMTAIVAAYQKEAAEQKEYKELKKRARVEEDKKQLNLFT